MDKPELRKAMLARRQALPPLERERRSVAAQEALIQAPAFAAAKAVLIYVAFRGEVATELLAEAAVRRGKRLVLPRVTFAPKGLVLHAYSGDPLALVKGAYGILEPAPDWPVVEAGEVDLVVIPGVAFDRTGGRLGYGGGYYDRLLPMIRAANPGVALVGLAYDFQVTGPLPRDPHDVPVDGLALDTGYYLVHRGEH